MELGFQCFNDSIWWSCGYGTNGRHF